MSYAMGTDASFSRILAYLLDATFFKCNCKPALYPALTRRFTSFTCKDIFFRRGKHPPSYQVPVQKAVESIIMDTEQSQSDKDICEFMQECAKDKEKIEREEK